MNPLTKAACFDRRKALRADIALSFICGIVFAALTIAFLITR